MDQYLCTGSGMNDSEIAGVPELSVDDEYSMLESENIEPRLNDCVIASMPVNIGICGYPLYVRMCLTHIHIPDLIISGSINVAATTWIGRPEDGRSEYSTITDCDLEFSRRTCVQDYCYNNCRCDNDICNISLSELNAELNTAFRDYFFKRNIDAAYVESTFIDNGQDYPHNRFTSNFDELFVDDMQNISICGSDIGIEISMKVNTEVRYGSQDRHASYTTRGQSINIGVNLTEPNFTNNDFGELTNIEDYCDYSRH